ncbi:MAG: ATP-binding protein, partial [Desulfobacterales bacterium]|nr:ATP-binding protein [Desulfobacterales bacterium]
KQVMVKKEVERAWQLAETVSRFGFDSSGKRSMNGLRYAMGHVVKGSAVSLVKIAIPDENIVYGFGDDPRLEETDAVMAKAMATGQPQLKKLDATPFLNFGGAVVVAAPLVGSKKGSVGVLVSTEEVISWLSSTVKLLFFYILVNFFVVTFAGVWQVSKVALKPVQRLLAKAENVDDEASFLFHDETGSEFSRLSMALNTMISRINADREKLKASVVELEAANEELTRAQEEVVRAEKLSAMGRLASGVAHEIGNPLGIVTGYLALIKKSDSPKEREDFILRVEEELSRMDGIIRQLLDFNRSGEKVAREPVSVHSIVEEMHELVRVQPLLKEISLESELGAEEDWVFAAGAELRQVFMNMVLNAADAIEAAEVDAGRIFIQTRMKDESQMEVVVEDNGGGIASEVLPNVFDPFFTTKDPGKGTGLGLSVSFLIVQGLGGNLRAENSKARGTRMIMELPVATLGVKKGEA